MDMNDELLVKWDKRHLLTAKHYSSFSKDPSTKVGAVIVRDLKYAIGHGYNGFPPEIEDTKDRLENRQFKLANVIHAEINAYNVCSDICPPWFTCYVWPFMSCSECAKFLLDKKIGRLVTLDYTPERWNDDFMKSLGMLLDNGVEVTRYPIQEFLL